MDKVIQKKQIDLSTIGSRIEYERKSKKFTQKDLAEKAGMSRQKINYIENDIKGRNITSTELGQIANALDVSTDYLLGRVFSKNIEDITVSKATGLNNECITILKNISNKNRSSILNSFLINSNLEGLTEKVEHYITITYVYRELLDKPATEIEKNYKGKKDVQVMQENINTLEKFLNSINKIMCTQENDYNMLIFMLKDNETELNEIKRICTQFKKYNDSFEYNKICDIDFKSFKRVKKTFKSFIDYFLYDITENNIKKSIEEVLTQSLQDKTIQKEIKFIEY